MMPVSVIGWLGLGVALKGSKLVEPLGYTRPPIAWSGEDQAPRIDGLTGPPATILYGGAFDGPGRAAKLLMFWQWTPPYSLCPGQWRGEEIRLIYTQPIQHSLNRHRLPDPPEFTIPSGHQLGTLNGQPVIAACRLAIAGGLLMSATAAAARRAPAPAEAVAE